MVLSLVIGVWVKLSPAYTTIPILSLGRFWTNLVATSFKASSRLGFRSLANMLAETSIAMTMSIPRVVLVRLLTSTFLGLAKARISKLRATNRRTYNRGFIFDQKFPFWNPAVLGMLRSALSFLRIRKNHSINKGMMSSNHKNSGFVNSKFANIS